MGDRRESWKVTSLNFQKATSTSLYPAVAPEHTPMEPRLRFRFQGSKMEAWRMMMQSAGEVN